MRLTMVSLVSELTSHGWTIELGKNIISSDPSLVVVAGIILFVRYCPSVIVVRNFSCDFSDQRCVYPSYDL